MNAQVAQWTLIIYAVLLIAGGAMGFVKARSRPSLIAGVVSGALAVACAWLTGSNAFVACLLGALLATLLAALFTVRFRKSRKWMPSGMMMLVSQAVAILMVIAAGMLPRT